MQNGFYGNDPYEEVINQVYGLNDTIGINESILFHRSTYKPEKDTHKDSKEGEIVSTNLNADKRIHLSQATHKFKTEQISNELYYYEKLYELHCRRKQFLKHKKHCCGRCVVEKHNHQRFRGQELMNSSNFRDYTVAYGKVSFGYDNNTDLDNNMVNSKLATKSKSCLNVNGIESSLGSNANNSKTSIRTKSQTKLKRSSTTKPSLIPRLKQNSSRKLTTGKCTRTTRILNNPNMCPLNQKNVQNIQFLKVAADIDNEDGNKSKHETTTRPIPTLNNICTQNDRQHFPADWYLDPVADYLGVPANSVESSIKCSKTSIVKTDTKLSSRSYRLLEDMVKNSISALPKTQISNTHNTSSIFNGMRVTQEVYGVKNENDWPVNQNVIKNDKYRVSEPVPVTKNKDDIDLKLQQCRHDIISLYNLKSEKDIIRKERKAVNNVTVVQEIKAIKTRAVNDDQKNIEEISRNPETALEGPITTLEKSGHSGKFQHQSNDAKPRSLVNKDEDTKSYIECQSEILQNSTDLDKGGNNFFETSSSFNTDTENRDSEGGCIKYQPDNDFNYSDASGVSKNKSQSTMTLSDNHSKTVTNDSCKSDYTTVTMSVSNDKRSVVSNSVFTKINDKHYGNSRRHCNNCRRTKKLVRSRQRGDKPFNKFCKHLSFRRLCKNNWHHVWKKTTERWTNWSKTPSSKRKRYHNFKNIRSSVIWEDVQVQTPPTVCENNETTTAVTVQKSTTTSLKYQTLFTPHRGNVETIAIGKLQNTFRPQNINLGPSTIPLSSSISKDMKTLNEFGNIFSVRHSFPNRFIYYDMKSRQLNINTSEYEDNLQNSESISNRAKKETKDNFTECDGLTLLYLQDKVTNTAEAFECNFPHTSLIDACTYIQSSYKTEIHLKIGPTQSTGTTMSNKECKLSKCCKNDNATQTNPSVYNKTSFNVLTTDFQITPVDLSASIPVKQTVKENADIATQAVGPPNLRLVGTKIVSISSAEISPATAVTSKIGNLNTDIETTHSKLDTTLPLTNTNEECIYYGLEAVSKKKTQIINMKNESVTLNNTSSHRTRSANTDKVSNIASSATVRNEQMSVNENRKAGEIQNDKLPTKLSLSFNSAQSSQLKICEFPPIIIPGDICTLQVASKLKLASENKNATQAKQYQLRNIGFSASVPISKASKSNRTCPHSRSEQYECKVRLSSSPGVVCDDGSRISSQVGSINNLEEAKSDESSSLDVNKVNMTSPSGTVESTNSQCPTIDLRKSDGSNFIQNSYLQLTSAKTSQFTANKKDSKTIQNRITIEPEIFHNIKVCARVSNNEFKNGFNQNDDDNFDAIPQQKPEKLSKISSDIPHATILSRRLKTYSENSRINENFMYLPHPFNKTKMTTSSVYCPRKSPSIGRSDQTDVWVEKYIKNKKNKEMFQKPVSDDSLADAVPINMVPDLPSCPSLQREPSIIPVMKDKNTSGEIVNKLKATAIQTSPNMTDSATEPISGNKRSTSTVTSRCILPAPTQCNHALCRTNCSDCLFVYDQPRCVVHKVQTDAAVQMCPAQRDIELEVKQRYSSDCSSGSLTPVQTKSSFYSPHSDRFQCDILHEVLSPKMYKALYDTTKLVVRDMHPNAPMNSPVYSGVDTALPNKQSRCSSKCCYYTSSCTRSRNIRKAMDTSSVPACEVSAGGEVTSQTRRHRHTQAHEILRRDQSVIANERRPGSGCVAAPSHAHSVNNPLDWPINIPVAPLPSVLTQTSNPRQGHEEPSRDYGELIDNHAKMHLEACRYYGCLLTKKLDCVNSRVSADRITPTTGTKMEEAKEVCTMKPSGRQELACQIPEAKLNNSSSTPVRRLSTSLTDLCNCSRSNLKSFYTLLTAIEGRFRRMRNCQEFSRRYR